jgi:CheY-like chemotaxis protein
MKVLVVDDEKAVADSTALVFRRFGHTAKASYSGEEALQAVKEFQPDLLLTDVKMTGMTGIDLAIQTCSQTPNCKVLLISGQAETSDLLEQARQHGHEFEILAKPVSPTELLDKAVGMVESK